MAVAQAPQVYAADGVSLLVLMADCCPVCEEFDKDYLKTLFERRNNNHQSRYIRVSAYNVDLGLLMTRFSTLTVFITKPVLIFLSRGLRKT